MPALFSARMGPEWWLAVRNLVYPAFCRQCRVQLLTEENGYFCPACWTASPRIERPYCSCCGQPHQEMRGFGSLANYPCATCREHPNAQIDRIYGAARYEVAIAEAVKLMKFHGKQRLALPLAEVMAEFAESEMAWDAYDALVPVPLHRVRQRERGFNQSALLAEALGGLLRGAPVDHSLERIRPTRTQSRLSREERLANVRGAFAVCGDTLQGKRVLLIDDVVTTAGTVTECARVLKYAGATSVDVFAVALSAPHTRWV
ncbi:MAG: ComF family protein [Candidatus Hydrogenedens sp.]|nr:ComF family protein [Candidatus Hydrogenedens sp.]